MLLPRIALTVFSLAALALAASPAVADEPKGDDEDAYASLEADRLFKQGVERMLKGEPEEGCPAIGRSYELDPRPGTLFTLGECEAQRGRLATAVLHLGRFVEIVSALPPARQTRYAPRKASAEKRCVELGPLVPKLVLRLPPDAPWTTEIKLDGELLDLRKVGVPHPVDPGTHTLTVQVPGDKAHEIKATVAKGETKSVALPVDVPAKPCAPTGAVAPPSGGACAACAVGSERAPAEGLIPALLGGLALLLRRRRRLPSKMHRQSLP